MLWSILQTRFAIVAGFQIIKKFVTPAKNSTIMLARIFAESKEISDSTVSTVMLVYTNQNKLIILQIGGE